MLGGVGVDGADVEVEVGIDVEVGLLPDGEYMYKLSRLEPPKNSVLLPAQAMSHPSEAGAPVDAMVLLQSIKFRIQLESLKRIFRQNQDVQHSSAYSTPAYTKPLV